jgi:hypothetical protein
VGMVSYDIKTILYIIYGIFGSAALMATATFGIMKLITYVGNKNLRKQMTDEEWGSFLRMERDKNYIPERLKKKSFPDKVADFMSNTSESIQESLIWNSIKAWHEKVCPIIKFE